MSGREAVVFCSLAVGATFYFSVGPDHTGRALKRAFRPGFLHKVRRTSVLEHYGWRTLLYGTLLPGPAIGARAGDVMRAVRDAGFEVGVHCYDHVRWQDGVAGASEAWTRREFERAIEAFTRVFGAPPRSHAAAGWQLNPATLALEDEFGLQYASDTRGARPFRPTMGAVRAACVQVPTTLPTFDELIGVEGRTAEDAAEGAHRPLKLAPRPLGARLRHAVLPAHVVVAVHADLEAGIAHRAHHITRTRPDVRPGQQRAVEERAPAVVLEHRGATHLAQESRPERALQRPAGVIGSDAEIEGCTGGE